MSDIHFQKGSFTYIFYCLLVDERFSRASVSDKWYYVEWKQTYFKSWCNFQYLLERTTVSIRLCKRKFFMELLYFKENLRDQVNKIIPRTVLSKFSDLHRLLWTWNTFPDDLTVNYIWNLMFELDMAQ